jgi:predicted O-methyltransferase YrrM
MKPYMQEKDIKAIEKLLQERKPKHVLEWGSGGSTIYFPKRAPGLQLWESIEHDKEWAEKVASHPDLDERAKVIFRTGAYANGYLTKASLQKADLIIIDGTEREACAKAAFANMRSTALVLVHDAGRLAYHKWFSIFPYAQRLTKGRVPDEKGGFKRDGLMLFAKHPLGAHRE